MVRWWAVGLLFGMCSGCAGSGPNDVTGPDEAAILILPLRRGAPTAASVRVDSVAVRLTTGDSGAASASTGTRLPAGTDTAQIRVTLLVEMEVVTLALTVEFLAAGNPVVGMTFPVSVRRGVETVLEPLIPATWEELATSAGPGPRLEAAFVRADALGGAILFGGLTAAGNDGQTWTLDDGVWSERSFPADQRPPGRHGHAAAFDSVRGEVVLFGGRVFTVAPENDTWTLGASGWTRREPAVAPEGRVDHAMAYDRRRGVVVLLGGAGVTGVLGDTWTWDGNTWTPAATSGPPARSGHTLTWNPVRQRILLFGGGDGSGPRSDLWEWDGVRWQVVDVGGAIPARRDHAAAWDGARGRLVVFGGQARGIARGDVWELAGTRWLPVEHTTAPVARFGAAMVDLGGDGAILFGGRSAGEFLADLWRYR